MRLKTHLSIALIVTLLVLLCTADNVQAYHARWDDRNPTKVNGPKDPPKDKEPNAGQDGDPVDLYTGNFSYRHTDLAVAGRGLSLVWQRHYNSQRDYIYGPFGPGWSFYYNISLTTPSSSDGDYVEVFFGDRTRYKFTEKDGVYENPPEFQGRLEQTGPYQYKLYDKTGICYTFGSAVKSTTEELSPAASVGDIKTLGSVQAGELRTVKLLGALSMRVLEISDRNGNKIAFSYTGQGRLDFITDTAGRRYSLTYHPSGNIASLTDPAGQVYRYNYDGQGRLSEYEEPNGAVTQYTYQAAPYFEPKTLLRAASLGPDELRDSREDASPSAPSRGNVSVPTLIGVAAMVRDTGSEPYSVLKTDFARLLDASYTVNTVAAGVMQPVTVHPITSAVLTGITDAKGVAFLTNQYSGTAVTSQVYNSGTFGFSYGAKEANGNRTVTVQNRNGVSTTYYLDAKGRPLTVTNCLGDKVQLTYNTAGNILSVINPNNDATKFTYDAKENCTQITDPLSQTVQMTYNEFSQVTSVIDQAGHKTEYIYDEKGNLLEVKNALEISNTFAYNDKGEMVEAKDADNNVIKFEYDENGYLKKTTDALNNVTQYKYDILGRLLEFTDARNNKTTYEYVYDGVSKVTDSKGNVTQFTYDINGNLETVTDALGRKTIRNYDQWKRLDSITDPLGNRVIYSYNAEDQVKEINDPNGNKVQYGYDDINRLTKVIDANNKETIYTYDKLGNLVKTQNAKGNIYTFEYDKLQRIIKTSDPLNRETSYTYYPNSLMKSATRPDGTIVQNEYDAINRLTKIIYPDQTLKKYSYDKSNRVVSINQGTTSLQFAYNALGRLTKATDVFGRGIGYTYDAVGNCTKMTAPGQKVFTYGYDELNRLTSIVSSGGTFDYEYDNVGRRTKTAYPNGKTATYAYDELDRLTALDNGIQNYTYSYDKTFNISSIDGPGGLTNYHYDNLYRITEVIYLGDKKESYTYDAVGNRLSRTITNGTAINTVDYDYNAANQLISAGSSQFTYDLRGRLTEKTDGSNITKYRYNQQNLLEAVLNGDDQEIAGYTYDPFGRRITSHSNNQVTQYLWDGESILADYSGSGTLQALYTMGQGIDEVLAINNGSNNYIHPDHLGSIAAVTAPDGNVVLERTYGAFGEVLSVTGNYTTGLGFTGRDQDANTGLIYLRNRFYDPGIGRFITEDPVQNGNNWYAYCGNNPLVMIDPFGLKEDWFDRWYVKNPYAKVIPIVGAAHDYTTALTGWDPINKRALNGWERGEAAINGSCNLILSVLAYQELRALYVSAKWYYFGGRAVEAATTDAQEAAYLRQRANDIHSTLSERTQNSTTTAVASVTYPDGSNGIMVASSEPRLRPAQQAALNPGEVAVSGPGHAEQTIINHANANGVTVNQVAASRPICNNCAQAINDASAKPASPLK